MAFLARRILAALREAERQADVVASILAPGPLTGSAKLSHAEQVAAEEAVRAATLRWRPAQPHRSRGCEPARGGPDATDEKN
jgi:hypothetical protein